MSEEKLVAALQETNRLLASLNQTSILDEILPWLPPAAIIVSVVVAFISARRAIDAQRHIARSRASLDLLLRLESDAEFLKASEVYRDVRNSRGLESLVVGKDVIKSKRDEHEEFCVDLYLNTLELICVGIVEGSLDERSIYQYMRGAIVNAWKASEGYAKKTREESTGRILLELQYVATAWDEHRFVIDEGDASKVYSQTIESKSLV
ncbi:DUF4760 domain-containing protein [Cobetia sp. MMG027]|uniref:DUF4760 domain-containing protein n=1 Tax=Cobetia sp. MMG027 TaxID=3021980 RepID=UPI0022FE7AB5|nr:DUF4760 domain-containing protein [Cobetia sp. MMG027]MDA5563940.1 DUF4760 domain-containing protein [Cobetia sp. MMG027]